MNTKKLFNYNCPVHKGSTTSIINGCTEGIINLNKLSYPWAYNLWEMMLANTWFPREVDLTEDAKQYRQLTPAEKRMYDKALSQLIFMDSIQTNNTPDNVNPWITAPEVNMCIVRQAFEEALHSQSYAVMVDSISLDTDGIYEMWRADERLRKKNEFIGNVYEEWGRKALEGNDEAKVYMIVANQALEGVYFYNGFAAFYLLARSGKMIGSSQMIRFIQRDELCVHPDTELLTADGWKKMSEITEDDIIAQYDMETEEISYSKPQRVIWREHKGKMYKLVDNRGNVLQNVTEGHDLVVKSISSKTGLVTIKKEKVEESKFNSYKKIPNSGFKNVGIDTLSPIERFSIALQADGSINGKRTGNRTGYQVYNFGFKKMRKVARLSRILNDIKKSGIPVVWTVTYSKGYFNYYIKLDNSVVLSKDLSHITVTDKTTNWAREFMEELKNWDGHKPKDRDSFYYSTTNERALDKILEVLAISGYKFKVQRAEDKRKETFSDIYRLSWWEYTNDLETQTIEKKSYDYDGYVGCVTMPKGTIITKYENNVCVTGNCHTTLFANIFKEIKKEYPDLFTPQVLKNIKEMLYQAYELERDWGWYITNDEILGTSKELIDKFTKYLVNKRAKAMDIELLFPEVGLKNPITWFDSFSKFNDQKTNFFEGNVVNYSKGGLNLNDF